MVQNADCILVPYKDNYYFLNAIFSRLFFTLPRVQTRNNRPTMRLNSCQTCTWNFRFVRCPSPHRQRDCLVLAGINSYRPIRQIA
jgi:hypothetical protein